MGDHLSGKPENSVNLTAVREFDMSWKCQRSVWEKTFRKNCLFLTSCSELHQCVAGRCGPCVYCFMDFAASGVARIWYEGAKNYMILFCCT